MLASLNAVIVGLRWDLYLCYSPNVLIPVLLGETQVFVQPESHIVAVETVRCKAKVKEMLLKRGRYGRFAGCAEAGEPNCEAALFAECVALAAREGWVPCDVAVVDW